jgi:Lipocalin-like domain
MRDIRRFSDVNEQLQICEIVAEWHGGQPSAQLEANLAHSAFYQTPNPNRALVEINASREAKVLNAVGNAAMVFGVAVIIGTAAVADERHPLIGNWKLVSWQVIGDDGKPQDVFGTAPSGYLVITPEGRSIVLTTASGRKPGTDETARAALQKSMLSYSGRYRVEGGDFITSVDISWNEEWNGTEQRRHYRIEGDKLFIETAPAPSMVSPGKTDFRRLIWVREK